MKRSLLRMREGSPSLLPSGIRRALLRLVALPRAWRKLFVFATDLIVCWIAGWIAYSLRLGEWELFSRRVLIFQALALGSWVIVALSTRAYRSATRFADGHSILSLLRACILLAALLTVVLVFVRLASIPRTLAVIHPAIFFLLVAGGRVCIASFLTAAVDYGTLRSPPRRVLIFGAGRTGQNLATSMRREPGLLLIGFIDDDSTLRGNLLHGRPVWHSSELELVLAEQSIDEVFLAVPSAKRSKLRALVDRTRKTGNDIGVRVLPTASQLVSGRVSVDDLRRVEVEQLLGRDEVPPHPELMSRNIRGRCVMVTGAGGSIGSELCRQIVRQSPRHLVMVERSEYALYAIDLELRKLIEREKLDVELFAELVDVADPGQAERVVCRYRPKTLYHAAAYKHVPLLEMNAAAGIHNNVVSTLNLSMAAERAGVSNFILISSDKAVRPTNVMGASKRVCELIIQARAAAQGKTVYASVRFGNVLGSSGSVVPHFRAQIASGGPVTITHRDATRYFMTIPEAAQLVIQAGALAGQGEVLLLDMGAPVRILDLARLMIELSGLTVHDASNPDGDIAIAEIGLRPGEKLNEELLIDGGSEATAHPRIIKASESCLEWRSLQPQLARLQRLLSDGDEPAVIQALQRLVPEYERAAPAPDEFVSAAATVEAQSLPRLQRI